MAGKNSKSIVLRELTKESDWPPMLPLLKLTNKKLKQREFAQLLPQMRAKGYRCLGAYEGEKLVGIMGFWVGVRFWCKKYIDIDNVVIAEESRSKGLGKKMLEWVEKEGKRQKCDMAMLDCYTTFYNAHRFYLREGYCILGYHLTKNL